MDFLIVGLRSGLSVGAACEAASAGRVRRDLRRNMRRVGSACAPLEFDDAKESNARELCLEGNPARPVRIMVNLRLARTQYLPNFREKPGQNWLAEWRTLAAE